MATTVGCLVAGPGTLAHAAPARSALPKLKAVLAVSAERTQTDKTITAKLSKSTLPKGQHLKKITLSWGEPQANLPVEVPSQDGNSVFETTNTNADGSVTFTVADGTGAGELAHFRRSDTSLEGTGQFVTISQGGPSESSTLSLRPLDTNTGLVEDTNDMPLSGVAITGDPQYLFDGESVVDFQHSTMTAPDGSHSLTLPHDYLYFLLHQVRACYI